jgi:two-component system, OmpR family, sensor histidine kinase KdpD
MTNRHDRLRQTTPMHHETLIAVAHDLRLPLSHIKGFVTTLRRTDVEWDDETRRDFLAEIDQELDRLAEMVESLLDAVRTSRTSAHERDLQFTDPASVVEGAIHRVRGLLGDRVVSRKLSVNLVAVRMNAKQMERVLANLLQNAVKYSPSSASIVISARITHDCELEFVVQDHGPGVPPAQQQRIFQPFFRTQSAHASDVSGHGLGLAICRSIVLAHRGRIEVANTPGAGASFSVFLPLNPSQGPGKDPAKQSRGRRRGPDSQTADQPSQGQLVLSASGGRWNLGAEAGRGAPIRPAAA